jgi:1-acyl-sn-glycerol-3-phosphate acyltransferase
MTKWGSFPLGLGNKLTLTIHQPVAVKGMPFTTIFEKTEQAVVESIVL